MSNKSKLKLVRTITDLPPDCYRLSTDGRKWKSLCEARQKLANWLALKGNPDGTQIFPGISKMIRVTGWSNGKVCYVLSDLEMIGCIVNENRRTKERGTSLRRFDPAPLLKANEAINRGEKFFHPTIQDTDQESKIAVSTFQDSTELNSKIDKPTFQDTEPHSKIEDLHSNAGLETTVDRPIKPTTTTVKKLEAVEWLSRFGHKKLGSFPINRAHRGELQALSDRDGFETFKQVCKEWFKVRNFDGLGYPAGKLLEEYAGTLEGVCTNKPKYSEEQLQAIQTRNIQERQARVERVLFEAKKQRAFEEETRDAI